MVDMGPISFYLSFKVKQNCKQKLIKLSLPIYIDKILQKFHLNQANLTNTYKKKNHLFAKQRCSSFTKRAETVLGNDRLHHVLDGWDITWYCFCHLCSNQICQKSKLLIQKSGENHPQIFKKITRSRHYV